MEKVSEAENIWLHQKSRVPKVAISKIKTLLTIRGPLGAKCKLKKGLATASKLMGRSNFFVISDL
jgi:hypothetical protein